MAIYTIQNGASVLIKLAAPMSYYVPNDSDDDTVEFYAMEAIRNNGEAVLTGEIRVTKEDDGDEV